MAKEVVKKEESKSMVATRATSPLNVLGSRFNIEPAKLMEVLRGTVIKPDKNGKAATNEEVAAFCVVASQYDLNPFLREIYAFASGEKGVTVIVPIDGWCKIVNRHKNEQGELDFDGCEFVETNDEAGELVSTTCRMFVKGRAHPIEATEYLSECKRETIPWRMKRRMLRHKAYIQAGRYAFGLGGLHDEDEARDITADVRVSDARPAVAMPTVKQVEAAVEVADEPKPQDEKEPLAETPPY